MSGAALHPMHIVFQHRRSYVLQRQLKEIRLLMIYASGDTPRNQHHARMHQRARELNSIEYCEDVIMHLNVVIDQLGMIGASDREAEQLCCIVSGICQDAMGDGSRHITSAISEEAVEERLDARNERRFLAMTRVKRLVELIVDFPNGRTWARKHLDLRRFLDWYFRMKGMTYRTIRADDFREINDLLMFRLPE